VRAVDQPPPAADVLVNCTSVGLSESSNPFKELPLDADAIGAHACVVDLVYAADDTALISAARARGCEVVDGLAILVHQGALSFQAWTGQQAPLDAMRKGARGGPPRRHDPRQPSSPPGALRHRGDG
jgi:shikimate 5-dehydrogenase